MFTFNSKQNIFLRMRSFRDFEIHRLEKFVENSREQDDSFRKMDPYHHKLVFFNFFLRLSKKF